MPELKKRLIDIPTRPGKPEIAKLKLPLRAPWVILGQHDNASQLVTQTWDHFKELHKEQLTDTLDLRLGLVAYQHDGSGGIELAAYHYDTSD